jgi:hypothetical protein
MRALPGGCLNASIAVNGRCSISPRLGRRLASDNRAVEPLDRVIVELPRKPLMRGVALGCDEDSAGSLVEPVHDARTQHTTNPRELGAVMEQRIHQRAARVPGRWMHNEPSSFVHHNEVLVFENDVERDVFGLRDRFDRCGRRGRNRLAQAQLAACARRGPFVDPDAARFYPTLRLRAGNTRKVRDHDIDALAGLILAGDEVKRGLGVFCHSERRGGCAKAPA